MIKKEAQMKYSKNNYMNHTHVYPATLSTNKLRASEHKNPAMRVARVIIRGEHAFVRVGHVARCVKRAFTHVGHVARRVKHALTSFTRIERHVERVEDIWTNATTRVGHGELRSSITHYTCYPWKISPTTRKKACKTWKIAVNPCFFS